MAAFPVLSLQDILPALAGLGTAVQLIVLGVLLVASIICWGIIVHKARALRTVRRHNSRFLDAFHSATDLPFMAAAARRFARAPMARLFRTAHQHMDVFSGRRLAAEPAAPEVTALAVEQLRHALHSQQTEELGHLEQGLPFLATTASVAPFVGLLGTVWGIMQSFHAIGQGGGGASLAVVGPGISEALVATAAGLAAAIPAVVAYNHYLARMRRLENEMQGFTEELVYVFTTSELRDAARAGNRTPQQR